MWRHLARHRVIACVLAGCVPVVVRLCLLAYVPIPEPVIHDEFAYLLGADTFASGRLANPPHPMWQHFETHHVIFQPSYAPKFPPAQSLVLAFGRRVFGHPWYGVLISVGLMCAAFCWMLQAWLPPPYPILGTLFAILQFGITYYWVNSYWGGAVAATGGALVAGALPRLARGPRLGAALAAATGALILANSRPYEGFVYVVASIAALGWWTRSSWRSASQVVRTPAVLVPLFLLFGGFAWMAFYNYRVTGSPWLLPTAHYQRLYSSTSQFWFVPLGPPVAYRHEMIRLMWEVWFHSEYVRARTDLFSVFPHFARVLALTFGPELRFLICVGVLFVPRRKTWVAATIVGACAAGLLLEVNMEPHYFAPATAMLIFLAMAGLRFTSQTLHRQHRPRVALAVVMLLLGIDVAIEARDVVHYRQDTFSQFTARRRDLIDGLLRDPSRHLVIVRYAPEHALGPEWVYNDADIDGSRIVWAQDMGPRNKELLDYYPDRKAWLFEPDLKTGGLKPYQPGDSRDQRAPGTAAPSSAPQAP